MMRIVLGITTQDASDNITPWNPDSAHVWEREARPMTPKEIAEVLVGCSWDLADNVQLELYNLLWDDPGYLSQARMNEEQSGG
jgi:hypothetical protein